MTKSGDLGGQTTLRPAVLRTIGFFALWLILSGGAPNDLLPGILAAMAASGISLTLLPAGKGGVRLLASAKFAIRLLRQSITAGADIARRALDPRLPVDPGLVYYPSGLPRGATRNTFTTLMSLLPGTVPIRAGTSDLLVVHCLDASQPVTDQLAVEEALLLRVVGTMRNDD